MRRDVRALLYDVQSAIQHIQKYVKGMDFAAYESDSMLQDAVERNFIIVGEAVRRMRLLDDSVADRVQKLTTVSDFRNFLVHEYESVSNERVWRVVTESMPVLKQQIDAWAAELGMEAPPEQAS